MAKHIFRREDEERTELLGHDELFVQKGKGSDTYYNAWLHDSEIECCPRCGSDAVKTQDLFSKTYLDLVSDGQRKKVIQLEYEFYKYRYIGITQSPIHYCPIRRTNHYCFLSGYSM